MDDFTKNIVNTYSKWEDLEQFAKLVGLENDVYVKERIFKLKRQELFDKLMPSIESQQQPQVDPQTVQHCHQNTYRQQESLAYFRPWLDPEHAPAATPMDTSHDYHNVTGPSTNFSQVGWGNTDNDTTEEQGPSTDFDQEGRGNRETNETPYTFRKKGEKVFAKNKAIEQTFEIKFNDKWMGNKLKDIHTDLHAMFNDVLDTVRGEAKDLGRVVVHHNGLDNPIVVPLQPWENLDSDIIMEGITNVLNSNEELIVDDSLEVNIGSIAVPNGSGGNNLPITSLFGPGNSLDKKKSIFEIDSEDNHLCLPKAIGICFLKTCKKVDASNWKDLTGKDKGSTMELAVKYKTCPKDFYSHMTRKTRRRKMQTDMALTLCKMAHVTTDRPLSLNDITPFEQLLDVNVLVVSSNVGNKFIRVIDNPDLHNIYVYLVEYDDVKHFHGISSISGFFGGSYFCETCLKAYKNRNSHRCESTCNVCTSTDCQTENPMSCRSCKRESRSMACFERHKALKHVKGHKTLPSQCNTRYQCITCTKCMAYEDRKPEEHRCGEWKCKSCAKYQVGDHFCYQRATNTIETKEKKFMFYDFETRQDDRMECETGYIPPDKRCRQCEERQDPCKTCRLCTNCRQHTCGLFKHVVNFAVLQSACSKCVGEDIKPDSKCYDCGKRCPNCWEQKKSKFMKPPCPDTCGFRERVFRGDDAAVAFCDHILQPHYQGFIVIAHNAKSFDLYPIMEVMIGRHALRPDKIIYNGSKIMYMHVAKKLNLTFMDSLNFIPMKLSKIPKTFGFEELQKGYFPHLFNLKENQSYIGPFPSPYFYGHDYMSTEDRVKFLKWHDGQRGQTFDFQTEMLEYCRSDVDILRKGCLSFREVMMKATSKDGKMGVDPFDYVTIAGACMGIYKSLFLEEEHETAMRDEHGQTMWFPSKLLNGEKCILYGDEWTPVRTLAKIFEMGDTRFVKSKIGMVPTEGYSRHENYSKVSIQWLEWIMESSRRKGLPIHISHALNGGEYHIPGTNYRADGYDVNTKTVYEFLGCVFHGCKVCYSHDRSTTTHPTTNQSLEELYAVTKKREEEIKRLGYKYKCIWEHQFHKQMMSNKEMKYYVSMLDVQDRLNPRESFFGGRTNAVKLHHKAAEGEIIEYYDFTSLYPWTNKYCRYPVGHPTILTENLDVDISMFFGIAKVKILPPRGLYHPVLPRTSNGKLKFPLCGTCADNEIKCPCTCTEEQRSFVGTWCTPELEKALEKGYKILKVYEVYHFEVSSQYDAETRTGGLFAPYVDTFLKIKQEASGWPQECQNDEDQKNVYIEKYREKEGIELEYEKIEKNPGLRFLAKLCLNSFWGKFGQRLGMKQSEFFHNSEAEAFFRMISDPRKNVQNFHILTPNILHLEWCDDPLFLPIDTKTNIFLASFTTCWARLKLYSVLDEVGEDCLYMDTDSVIFVDRNHNHVDKLQIGNFLGELTNEVPSGEYIVEYISGGPKNYAYRTSSGNEVCKVRGFTLNFTNSRLINFDAVKDLVLQSQKSPTLVEKKKRKRKSEVNVIVTSSNKISRDAKEMTLYNRREDKQYKIVYTKRVVLPNFNTIPYGY